MLILILIGCYYLINALIFAGIHTKKTSSYTSSNITSYQSLNNKHSTGITSVVNIRNNGIIEPLLSPDNEPHYDVGYQLN
jgi:hypothetical protein